MKIAFATTDEKNINEHFGRAGKFAVYHITKEGFWLAEVRKFSEGIDQDIVNTKGMGEIHEDRVQGKVERLADCKIIYMTEIGGPSAARLVKKGIMPMKVKTVTAIEDVLKQLLETIKNSPPLWLRKAMNT